MQGEKIHRNGIVRLSRLSNRTKIYGKEMFNRKKGQADEYKIISFCTISLLIKQILKIKVTFKSAQFKYIKYTAVPYLKGMGCLC